MTGLSSAAQAVWCAHEQVLGDECVLTATDMKALAAAQAVLDAYNSGFDRPVAVHHKPRIAAALRAAANQLTPYSVEDVPGAAFCRNKILAIANELEGNND